MNIKVASLATLTGAALVLLVTDVGAHNTNSFHPRMTAAAGTSIAATDEQAPDPEARGAYSELYYQTPTNVRLHWGDDIQFNQLQANADEEAGYARFNRAPLNAVDGSVHEDIPTARVVSHFYHAYNGGPLHPPGIGEIFGLAHPSPIEAFRYFDQAVEVFDYQQQFYFAQAADGTSTPAVSGKALGFWLLGHALHQVEDMSSIAHVQNDAHLPFEATRDTFEDQYVPTMIWAVAENVSGRREIGQSFLTSMSATSTLQVRSFEDIWAAPQNGAMELNGAGQLFANSLARASYNLAVFHGQFDRPIWFPEDPPTTADCPSGELAEMLNGETPGQCGPTTWLYYTGAGAWHIRNVGDWDYMGRGALTDAWWAVSPNYQATATLRGPAVLEDQGEGSYFYIENHNNGRLRGNGAGGMLDENLLAPWGLRADFSKPWDPANNRVVRNQAQIPIVKLIADRILPHGAAHVAGLSRLWYDVVNPPPFLQRVLVRQGSAENETVCYDGSWKEAMGARTLTLTNKAGATATDDAVQTFGYVKRRDLNVVGAPQFINPLLPFTIELEFSEPIQTPTAETFSLSFGGVPVPFSQLTITDLRPGESQKWLANRKWLVSLPAAPPSLNGRVRLGINARDRNYHFVSTGNRVFGAVLDTDPRTPARRQRVRANQQRVPFFEDRAQYMSYSWHTTSSRDVNYPVADVPAGGFAYDQAPNGDQNHVLLFDSTPPTGTATVTYPPP